MMTFVGYNVTYIAPPLGHSIISDCVRNKIAHLQQHSKVEWVLSSVCWLENIYQLANHTEEAINGEKEDGACGSGISRWFMETVWGTSFARYHFPIPRAVSVHSLRKSTTEIRNTVAYLFHPETSSSPTRNPSRDKRKTKPTETSSATKFHFPTHIRCTRVVRLAMAESLRLAVRQL